MPLQPDDDFLRDLLQRTTRLLEEQGVSAEDANQVASELCAQVRADWGGQQLYIRKASPEEMTQRDQLIYNEFNGRNHLQLARKHNLSTAHIYHIVKLAKARERASRQHHLFESSSR
jgi:Mor family transcriptional regulator